MLNKVLLGKNITELGTYKLTLGYRAWHTPNDDQGGILPFNYRIGYLNDPDYSMRNIGALEPTEILGHEIIGLYYGINADAYGDGGYFGVRLAQQIEGVERLFLQIKGEAEVFILERPGYASNAIYNGYYSYNGPFQDYEVGETVEFTLSAEYPKSMLKTIILGDDGERYGYNGVLGIGAMSNTDFCGSNVESLQFGWMPSTGVVMPDGGIVDPEPYKGPGCQLNFTGSINRDYSGIVFWYNETDDYGIMNGLVGDYGGDGGPPIEYEEGKVVTFGMHGVGPTREFANGVAYLYDNLDTIRVYREGKLVETVEDCYEINLRVMAGDEIWIGGNEGSYLTENLYGIEFSSQDVQWEGSSKWFRCVVSYANEYFSFDARHYKYTDQ